MNSQNPYEILQVSINAESEVIDAAYRKLAFKYHPDRYFGIDADEKMKNINWAYSILGDPQKRIMYDVFMKPHNQQNQQEKLSITNSKEYLEDSPEKRIQNARKILDITGSIGWMFITYFVCAIILLSILPLSMQQYIIPGVFVFLVIINIISRSVREKLLTKDELIRERKEEEQLTNSGR